MVFCKTDGDNHDSHSQNWLVEKATITSLLINIHEMFCAYFLRAARCYRDVVGRIHDSVPGINQQA